VLPSFSKDSFFSQGAGQEHYGIYVKEVIEGGPAALVSVIGESRFLRIRWCKHTLAAANYYFKGKAKCFFVF
jgi:hypothetical protein